MSETAVDLNWWTWGVRACRTASRGLAHCGARGIKDAPNRRARAPGSSCPARGLEAGAAAKSGSVSQAGDGRRGSRPRWAGRARRG